jgi:3-hydroxy-9,10-secoandrosta-1,3,5(10)-triene-9,17-dione monooxygenase
MNGCAITDKREKPMTERSVAELLEAVRDLLPTLRERAQETEDLRRVPDASMKSLKEAGWFNMLQPKRWGGLEASPIDFYRGARLVASACASTGWLTSVVGVHPWQLALFADQAQQDVWGEDNATLISSSYAPMGRAKAVDGGFQMSGHWSFSSGCDHAQWVMLGGLVMGEDGTPTDFRTFLLPRADYEIVDVWDTVGLRGTGSNDIIVKDVFVPEHRTLSFNDTGRCYGPGQELNTAPLYKLPFASVFSCGITVPILGMADGAYKAYVDYTRERIHISGNKAAEDGFNQLRIAEAAGMVDAATLQIERNLSEELALAEAGEKIPISLRLRVRRDQVRSTLAAISAIDKLFVSSGGRALKTGTPLQRFWRDAHSGRVHAINDPEKAQVLFGQFELGIKTQDAWV